MFKSILLPDIFCFLHVQIITNKSTWIFKSVLLRVMSHDQMSGSNTLYQNIYEIHLQGFFYKLNKVFHICSDCTNKFSTFKYSFRNIFLLYLKFQRYNCWNVLYSIRLSNACAFNSIKCTNIWQLYHFSNIIWGGPDGPLLQENGLTLIHSSDGRVCLDPLFLFFKIPNIFINHSNAEFIEFCGPLCISAWSTYGCKPLSSGYFLCGSWLTSRWSRTVERALPSPPKYSKLVLSTSIYFSSSRSKTRSKCYIDKAIDRIIAAMEVTALKSTCSPSYI